MGTKITGAELEIMEYLWEKEQPCTFAGLLEYFNGSRHKEWCKQTLNTNLLRLKRRGFLKAEKEDTKTRYFPSITRAEYETLCAKKILEESYGGSLGNFLAALTGGTQITEAEKQELINYIRSFPD